MARMTKISIDTNARTITWEYPESGLEPVVLHAAKVSVENQDYAILHGLNQRCTDNAASAKTAEEKRAATLEMVEFYESGTASWERTRAAGGPKFDAGAVVTALARVKFEGDIDRTNRAVEAVMAKRGIDREATLKMFAQDAEIAADMARARAAAKPVKFDADAELAGLMG